jgi:hypothetical protein
MSVYVDEPIYKLGRMIMCHMMADTPDELHAMAAKIGIARGYFQSFSRYKHYDICKAKRALAVQHGAIETTSRDLIKRFRRKSMGGGA